MRISSQIVVSAFLRQIARIKVPVASAAILASSLAFHGYADDTDWAQWRGPARDGRAAPQSLLKSWPETGPKLLWSTKTTGLGYSAVSVSNGRLYTLGQRGAECVAICLDAKTGNEIWAQRIDRGTEKGDYLTEWGGGPRSAR